MFGAMTKMLTGIIIARTTAVPTPQAMQPLAQVLSPISSEGERKDRKNKKSYA
jgi:hypothetical protein